jgi:hypothetical protein
MTQLMKSCSEMSENIIEQHQWVRIKKGVYQDDLGLVELIENNSKALVRLVPRIPNAWYSMKEDECKKLTRKDYSNTI